MNAGRIALGLVLGVACLLPVRSAVAQQKVDLAPWFLPEDEVGDYRIERSEFDTTRRADLLSITSQGKRLVLRFLVSEYGAESTSELVIVPGKKLLRGDSTLGDYDVDLRAPQAYLPLKLRPGKWFKYRGAARLLLDGVKAGTLKRRGQVRFVGFEPRVTPAFSREETARIERTETVTITPARGFAGPVLTRVHQWTEWVAADLSTIDTLESSQFYEDGVLIDEDGPTRWWLESGVLGGEPVP